MNVNTGKFSSPEEVSNFQTAPKKICYSLPLLCLLQVIEHSFYVQKMIKDDINKTSSGYLLNGYIEFHNKTCLNAACPLKKIIAFNVSVESTN